MPEPVQAGERGVHRFRSVFFSESDRFARCEDPIAADARLKDRMRESASHRRAVSYLIADCRLTASGSHLLAFFPAELRERLTRLDGKSGMRDEADGHGIRLLRWQHLLALIAGAAGAAAGFWIYFHQAL
ncbi:MAG: hypothetical protein IT169_19940 [Bryobacterales bacterium]|nr:hypothetical protein [Bryobacterales bacterium]